MSRLTDELMNSAPWASTEERAEWWRNKCYEVFEELEHYRHLEEQGRLIVQKRGRWIEICNGKVCVCSECDEKYDHTYDWCCEWNYCPNCGAKMLKGTEE